MTNIFHKFQKDKEIQEMMKCIYKETGEYEGLMIWEGERVEECRQRYGRK